MKNVLMKCPFCNSVVEKDAIEGVGPEDLDFITKSKGVKSGFKIEIGSISIGNDNVIHGVLTDSYLCKECKKIISIYDY